MDTCFLSIIIPVYNEETRLPGALKTLFSFLNSQQYSYEVLVVENGSTDQTYNLAQALAAQHSQMKVLRETERGKGWAVRRGMLEAVGDYRFMCDVDFSMPVMEINRFLPPALTDYHVVIASREMPGAVRYNEPFHRHLIGRVFNQFIRLFALPAFRDTQCGFKCFQAQAAEELFAYLTISGWTFDVEILYIASLRGMKIAEIPVPWYYNADSKVHVWRDSLRMALDLLAIRRNARQGRYTKGNASKD